MNISRIKFLGGAGILLGVIAYFAYEYELPGMAIGGGALLWGSIEGRLDKLFAKDQNGENLIDKIFGKRSAKTGCEKEQLELMKTKIRYLETKTQLLQEKLKSK